MQNNDKNDINQENSIPNTNTNNDLRIVKNIDSSNENSKPNENGIIKDDILEKLKDHEVPEYLVDVYSWAYVKPKNIDRLDNVFVYHAILFGQGSRLMRSYLEEINEGDRILQVAHVYGNIIPKMANKIGDNGRLDIIDVVPHQLERAKKKLSGYKNYEVWLQDASLPYHRDYDMIGIYFLLHEVPDYIKTKIINNALDKIDENNAKVVFIDYHGPYRYHPVRPILSLVNIYLEPFANVLWENEISSFTSKADQYNWQKTTFFGGVYQKVVVTKKI